MSEFYEMQEKWITTEEGENIYFHNREELRQILSKRHGRQIAESEVVGLINDVVLEIDEEIYVYHEYNQEY